MFIQRTSIFVWFSFGVMLSRAQGLFLPLCSGAVLTVFRGPHVALGTRTRVSPMQGKRLLSCPISPVSNKGLLFADTASHPFITFRSETN